MPFSVVLVTLRRATDCLRARNRPIKLSGVAPATMRKNIRTLRTGGFGQKINVGILQISFRKTMKEKWLIEGSLAINPTSIVSSLDFNKGAIWNDALVNAGSADVPSALR